jgi:hypothetical protein
MTLTRCARRACVALLCGCLGSCLPRIGRDVTSNGKEPEDTASVATDPVPRRSAADAEADARFNELRELATAPGGWDESTRARVFGATRDPVPEVRIATARAIAGQYYAGRLQLSFDDTANLLAPLLRLERARIGVLWLLRELSTGRRHPPWITKTDEITWERLSLEDHARARQELAFGLKQRYGAPVLLVCLLTEPELETAFGAADHLQTEMAEIGVVSWEEYERRQSYLEQLRMIQERMRRYVDRLSERGERVLPLDVLQWFADEAVRKAEQTGR